MSINTIAAMPPARNTALRPGTSKIAKSRNANKASENIASATVINLGTFGRTSMVPDILPRSARTRKTIGKINTAISDRSMSFTLPVNRHATEPTPTATTTPRSTKTASRKRIALVSAANSSRRTGSGKSKKCQLRFQYFSHPRWTVCGNRRRKNLMS